MRYETAIKINADHFLIKNQYISKIDRLIKMKNCVFSLSQNMQKYNIYFIYYLIYSTIIFILLGAIIFINFVAILIFLLLKR